MAIAWKQRRWRLDKPNQIKLLFGIVVTATAAWIITGLIGLLSLILGSGSWGEFWGSTTTVGDAIGSLLKSKLFQALVVALGWHSWYRMRRNRQDQLRLRRSEEKYRTIINHAGEAIFLLDGQGRVQEWNKAAENLFSEPRRGVLGRPFVDVHLCYGVEIDRAMSDAKKLQRSLNFEFPFPRHGRQDGQISLTITPIATGQKRADDSPYSFVVIARDITSEKQLESKMSETEKLAGIGQLAAGIAHQLNTPLGSILLSAQMVEEAVRGKDEEEDVHRIIRQTEQCRTIIKGLLNFARTSGRERGRLNLGNVIKETIYLMEKNIKVAGVEVDISQECDAIVHGNRNELDQVFFNLLANSLDALPNGGKIDIILRDGGPGEVQVVFADSGEGIHPEHREKVFLPFFTTKEYGRGTGLGLSIVARIIHEHGGRIEMESEVGAGTRFLLSLPRPGLGLGPDKPAGGGGAGTRDSARSPGEARS